MTAGYIDLRLSRTWFILKTSSIEAFAAVSSTNGIDISRRDLKDRRSSAAFKWHKGKRPIAYRINSTRRGDSEARANGAMCSN
jgi:hypothetical protein